MSVDDEEQLLRLAALQNVQSILQARNRAEKELVGIREALEEERRSLELLNRIGTKLASTLDVSVVVQALTDAATELSGAQFGAFFYRTAGKNGHVLEFHTGAPREVMEDVGPARMTSWVATRFPDAGVVPSDGTPSPPGAQGGSFISVPVVAQSGEAIGALFFGHGEAGVFTERSRRLIVGVAAQAAIAIDNARLYEDARRSADERARLFEAERIARGEVERVSLMKDEFLATLSHELRTPLNSVLGWSEILLSRIGDDPETRRGLESIARNARAQAQLIEDLLDMNRIVSGKIRLDMQSIDVAPVVLAALDSVRPSAEAKSIAVRRTIDPNAGPLSGDPNRLQQVVWNLLTNAVKFTPRGGKIDVIVQRVSSHVEIIVQDSGTGISPEFLPHLFERFRQADSSTTRRFGGLGLGLSIVKQLVEIHGGTVKAESGGLGKGATFIVTVPLRAVLDPPSGDRGHPTSGRLPSVAPAGPSLAGMKVLILDDEPDARELIASVLSHAAAGVLIAATAEEGLALVTSQRPDVIVSDIGMPDRDGYEFIRCVRRLGSAVGGRIPAIALTAFARSEDRTRAMLAGYQVHISKPVEPQELVASIISLVGYRSDRDA